MFEFLKCGTKSFQNAAMTVAIIDTICTSILLILFVLGSSLMVAFEIIGNSHNATRVLDIVTDNVFGTVQTTYNTIRERKDVAEDMGVWLIIMFLTIVDFIISCIFLDGVKSRDSNKVQIWLNIRLVIIVVFKIVVLINLVYGTSWLHAIPDMIFTIYRVIGLYVGYAYLQELRAIFRNSGNNSDGIIRNNSSLNLPTIDVSSCRSSMVSTNSAIPPAKLMTLSPPTPTLGVRPSTPTPSKEGKDVDSNGLDNVAFNI